MTIHACIWRANRAVRLFGVNLTSHARSTKVTFQPSGQEALASTEKLHHMPGSVTNAAPTTVMPNSLSRAFVAKRKYPVIANEHRNGESQRSVQASTSRKKWMLTKRLTPTQLAALRNFYNARNGTLEPFYFYDPYETNPKFLYDPTGATVTGRYTVRFNSDWSQFVTPGRSDVQIELIELA